MQDTTASSTLQCSNLKKTFTINGTKMTVVNDFSHVFESGKLYVIKGSSGCGKSTLLSMISLLQNTDQGEILISGRRVDKLDEHEKQKVLLNEIGIVFQDSNLLPGLSVYDNIILAATCEKNDTPENIRNRAQHLIKLLQIEKVQNSFPMQISGGERQRAGIARAIMNNPNLLVCDEPISSLDEENSEIIFHFLSEYCHQENKIVIVSCHSSMFDSEADEILKMERAAS